MRTTSFLIVFLSLLYTSPAAADCPIYYDCEVKFNEIDSNNCVHLEQYQFGSCYIVARNDCPSKTIFVTTDDGEYELPTYQAPLSVLYFDPQDVAPQTKSIAWNSTRDGVEESGTLTVTLRSNELLGKDCDDDPFCAATPPQRPAAPLTAMLPLLLSALIWRRRTTPQGA